MTSPAPLTTAAVEVFRVLRLLGERACLIGGLAVQRWGEPRATQDVDITVLAPFGAEASIVDALLSRLSARRDEARAFALQHRVLLLVASNGVSIDVSLAGLPFEREVLERATLWREVEGEALTTCSAEDLVVYKLVAARPQDLVDITGVVRRQGQRLDVERIRRWGREFADLKEDPDLLRPFEESLRAAIGRRPPKRPPP